MDRRISVYDRLEYKASQGLVGCKLNLYKRQMEKLLKEGVAIQKGLPVAGWKGQYECMLNWRYAVPNTMAWYLLDLAANSNPELKEALSNPEVGNVPHPYQDNWFNKE